MYIFSVLNHIDSGYAQYTRLIGDQAAHPKQWLGLHVEIDLAASGYRGVDPNLYGLFRPCFSVLNFHASKCWCNLLSHCWNCPKFMWDPRPGRNHLSSWIMWRCAMHSSGSCYFVSGLKSRMSFWEENKLSGLTYQLPQSLGGDSTIHQSTGGGELFWLGRDQVQWRIVSQMLPATQ